LYNDQLEILIPKPRSQNTIIEDAWLHFTPFCHICREGDIGGNGGRFGGRVSSASAAGSPVVCSVT